MNPENNNDLNKDINHINLNQSNPAYNNQNQNIYKEQYEDLTPNFTKQELSAANLPDKIAKEIRHEKYRIFFINFLSIIFLVTSIFFILAYFVPNVSTSVSGEETKWTIPIGYIPHPAFMFILMALGLFMFILSTIQYAHVITSVNKYKADILMHRSTVPYFLVKDYKSLISRAVYVNWITISIYVISGIIIGIFFALRSILDKPYNTELIVMYCILGITFAFQLISLITIKYRKGNLNSYYGHELVPGEEARAISKKANKVCLITFLVIIGVILVFVVIPYLLIRKKKGLPFSPFKS